MKAKDLMKFFAGLSIASMAVVSCQDPAALQANTLEVSPASAITFLSSGNDPVVLTVTTDADSWDYTVPEWIEASKDGNTLTLNAEDNSSSVSRSGRVQFTAGNAEPVYVTVLQESVSGGVTPDGISASLVDVSGSSDVSASVNTNATEYTSNLKVVLSSPAASEMKIRLSLDLGYEEEYSYTHDNIECTVLPETSVTFGNDGVITIPAGETESDLLQITFDMENVSTQTNYLVSVLVDEESCPADLSFTTESKRVNYLVVKRFMKEIRNVVYLEVNNTNPLNLLEYKLEDGTPFFDVAILFAANINYDSGNDRVYLHNNPNVQALLDQTDVYIQPLRKAGIEVQLGLLPNWTPAGLVNLSIAGCEMFAYEVAFACAQYGLDGASMDEEYRKGTSDSYLFNPVAPGGGMYLCYELKKQMAELCDWPCKISVFDYGWDYSNITVDGVEYTVGDLIDFHVANYGGASRPYDGETLKNCSGISIECNQGWNSMTEESARKMKNDGYGWCMWFGFHPQVGGGLTNNAPQWDDDIAACARGFYDQELQTPTGYYTKIGDGVYDPKRYDRTW